MRPDSEVNLHLLYAATLRRLQGYADLVRENRQVAEALDFARYVLNSRFVEVLAPHDARADLAVGDLKVDSALLRWTTEELQRACTERFRLNDGKPHLEALQFQPIDQKLDKIAAYLGKVARVGRGERRGEPDLTVIPGGLDAQQIGGPSDYGMVPGCYSVRCGAMGGW